MVQPLIPKSPWQLASWLLSPRCPNRCSWAAGSREGTASRRPPVPASGWKKLCFPFFYLSTSKQHTRTAQQGWLISLLSVSLVWAARSMHSELLYLKKRVIASCPHVTPMVPALLSSHDSLPFFHTLAEIRLTASLSFQRPLCVSGCVPPNSVSPHLP